MLKTLRGWGVPVGLLTLWGIAAAYTVHALIGMNAPSEVPVMYAPPMIIEMPKSPKAS